MKRFHQFCANYAIYIPFPVTEPTVPSTHKFTLARACIRVERESRASQLASAISPRYAHCCECHSIPIYGIPTDDYVSFKLLIVYVFVPAVLL